MQFEETLEAFLSSLESRRHYQAEPELVSRARVAGS